ncbi:MAG: GNAT family N-acetyltransferase, partial [Bdellovibrionales bacterium]|nr:GNAT family N-acetyltransferase [Bdellovibrionales bacterium]
ELSEAGVRYTVFVAVERFERITGMLLIEWLGGSANPRERGRIAECIVTVDARSRGVQRQLFDTVEQEVRAQGCAVLELSRHAIRCLGDETTRNVPVANERREQELSPKPNTIFVKQ